MPTPIALFRRLAERIAAIADYRFTAIHIGRLRPHAFAPEPLLWRTPWQVWQFLSWVLVTLLAPTFWLTGILLLINPNSDQPLFWPLMMGIVALTNAIAIVHTNQRHHHRPLTGYTQVTTHYFGVCMITGCVLFLLLAWNTGILQEFAVPLAPVGNVPHLMLWAFVTVGFGLLSFAHAGVLHGWIAFEP